MNGLRNHRAGPLRLEAFYSHMLYAIARKIPKEAAFPKCSQKIDIRRLKDKAKRFKIDHRDVDDWINNKPL
jgi:hypothetical protein